MKIKDRIEALFLASNRSLTLEDINELLFNKSIQNVKAKNIFKTVTYETKENNNSYREHNKSLEVILPSNENFQNSLEFDRIN